MAATQKLRLLLDLAMTSCSGGWIKYFYRRKGQAMSEQEKVENCYREMYRGMIDKDRNVLSDVLDNSFVLIHMTGMRQSKEAFIQAVEDGMLNYYSADHQQMEANVYGSRAELIGQSRVNAAVFGGGRNTWRLQLKLELEQTAGVWKITEARASTY